MVSGERPGVCKPSCPSQTPCCPSRSPLRSAGAPETVVPPEQKSGSPRETERRKSGLGRLKEGGRGFPNNSRQSMNHMQMIPKAQTQLVGGVGGNSSPGGDKHLAPSDPLLCQEWGGAGRISNQNRGLELFINFPGTYTLTHTHSHNLSPPSDSSVCRQGLGGRDDHYSLFPGVPWLRLLPLSPARPPSTP